MEKRQEARRRYNHHRRRAESRGIIFNITFDEWDSFFLQNGVDKNESQGPFTGNTLCMCRYNDDGPYELRNIYCATQSQNNKDVPSEVRKQRHKKAGESQKAFFKTEAGKKVLKARGKKISLAYNKKK